MQVLEAAITRKFLRTVAIPTNSESEGRDRVKEKNKESQRRFYLRNKDQKRESVRLYYLQNLSKRKEYLAQYRHRNNAEIQEYNRQYRNQNRLKNLDYNIRNKHRIAASMRDYYIRNKDKVKKTARESYVRTLDYPDSYAPRLAALNSWKSPERVREFFELIAKRLQILHYTDWYRISRTQVSELGGVIWN
jgi:hypothetical protein